MGPTISTPERNLPMRCRASALATRWSDTKRHVADLLRQAVADGVATKRGRFIYARPSELDAWLLSGGKKRSRP